MATNSTLQEVLLSDAVLQSCYSHALTTEKEEIMGVLIGEWIAVSSTHKVAHVVDSFIMMRSDKRSDRVEIAGEQLVLATEYAEKKSAAIGRRLKVCGWYHSHPHITPYPSHVDLSTQGTYQSHLEAAWVGLIFSVFHTDKKRKSGDCSVHAFASRVTELGGYDRVDVPLKVVPSQLLLDKPLPAFQMLPKLSENLVNECDNALSESMQDVKDPLLGQMLNDVHTQQVFKMTHGVTIPQANALKLLFIPQMKAHIEAQEKELLALEEMEKNGGGHVAAAVVSAQPAAGQQSATAEKPAPQQPTIDDLLSLS